MRLAIFQPDIPQNLGAAIRLCACLGAHLEIIEPCAFPLSDKAIRRAALDYGPLARITRHAAWDAFRAVAERERARIILLTTKSATSFLDFTFRADDILLMGSESRGAPEEVHRAADARLLIPLAPGARSLNVVTAAAIVLGEALRQTGGFPAPPALAHQA
jgi:tRNA (cytidine/uridine-2'-O-)-methyltransferase